MSVSLDSGPEQKHTWSLIRACAFPVSRKRQHCGVIVVGVDACCLILLLHAQGTGTVTLLKEWGLGVCRCSQWLWIPFHGLFVMWRWPPLPEDQGISLWSVGDQQWRYSVYSPGCGSPFPSMKVEASWIRRAILTPDVCHYEFPVSVCTFEWLSICRVGLVVKYQNSASEMLPRSIVAYPCGPQAAR